MRVHPITSVAAFLALFVIMAVAFHRLPFVAGLFAGCAWLMIGVVVTVALMRHPDSAAERAVNASDGNACSESEPRNAAEAAGMIEVAPGVYTPPDNADAARQALENAIRVNVTPDPES